MSTQKVSQFQALSPFGTPFVIYANQSLLDAQGLGSVIRFTADSRSKVVYAWNFNEGHHSDASRALQLNDQYSSSDFLRGTAEKITGKYVFISSDFLASFRGRLLAQDRQFLITLFSKDWSWADEYIEITDRLDRFRETLGL